MEVWLNVRANQVQLAKQVFDIAVGEVEDTVSESKRHPSKRRVGGLNGGKA